MLISKIGSVNFGMPKLSDEATYILESNGVSLTNNPELENLKAIHPEATLDIYQYSGSNKPQQGISKIVNTIENKLHLARPPYTIYVSGFTTTEEGIPLEHITTDISGNISLSKSKPTKAIYLREETKIRKPTIDISDCYKATDKYDKELKRVTQYVEKHNKN